jgi:hypothetical protein
MNTNLHLSSNRIAQILALYDDAVEANDEDMKAIVEAELMTINIYA